jgi:hypothetical protein
VLLEGTERTRGVILQNYYRKYYQDVVVTHQNIHKDPVAQEFMLDALDKPGPVDRDWAARSLRAAVAVSRYLSERRQPGFV